MFLECFKSSIKEKCYDVTMLKFETSHYYVEQDKTKRTYLHVMTIVFSPSHAGFSAITLACVVTSCGESCGNSLGCVCTHPRGSISYFVDSVGKYISFINAQITYIVLVK